MICAARPTTKASIGKVSLVQGRISARSVKAQYKVTLETPTGTETLEVDDSTYILDAAEVRYLIHIHQKPVQTPARNAHDVRRFFVVLALCTAILAASACTGNYLWAITRSTAPPGCCLPLI
jgi:hypothetical protein